MNRQTLRLWLGCAVAVARPSTSRWTRASSERSCSMLFPLRLAPQVRWSPTCCSLPATGACRASSSFGTATRRRLSFRLSTRLQRRSLELRRKSCRDEIERSATRGRSEAASRSRRRRAARRRPERSAGALRAGSRRSQVRAATRCFPGQRAPRYAQALRLSAPNE